MKNMIYAPHKSTIGNLDANLVALLVYFVSTVAGWIPIVKYAAWLAPLVVFFVEKNSRLVRFHSMQAFMLEIFSSILAVIVAIMSAASVMATTTAADGGAAAVATLAIIMVIYIILLIVITVFSIIAMVGAWNYKEKHIPLVGSISEKIIGK